MSEYPEDVMKAAIAARQAGFDSGSWFLEEPHINAIAAAIMAERERCAQIADEHALSCASKINKKRGDYALAVFESAASEGMSIAHCIRNGATA